MDRLVLEKIQEAKKIVDDDETIDEKKIREFLDGLSFDYENDEKKLVDLSYNEFVKLYFYLMYHDNFEYICHIVDKYPDLFGIKSKEILKVLICFFNDKEVNYCMKKLASNLTVTEILSVSTRIGKIAYRWKLDIFVINKVASMIYKNKSIALDDFIFFEGINVVYLLNLLKAFEMVVNNKDGFENNVYMKKGIKFILSFIYDKYNLMERKKAKNIRNINRYNQRLDELINILDTDEEIGDIESILRLCPNESLKNIVLDYVIKHNNACYEKLLEDLEKLHLNGDKNIEFVFNMYGYSLKEVNEEAKEQIKSLSLEVVENILKWFKKHNLHLDLNRLGLIDIRKIEIAEDLLNTGFLSRKFVAKHLNIVTDNNDLSLIVDNISLLNRAGINMINYNNSLEILLSEIIKDNLRILNGYGLYITRDTKAITFLKDKRLEAKIELIIEMGLFDSLVSLDILNYSFEELFRRKVYRFLGISEEMKIDFYYHEDFYTDSSLFVSGDFVQQLNSGYLRNVELPDCLVKYKINDKVLFINGVYVSIVRVLNNLSRVQEVTEMNIYYALIYGAYYSLIEMQMLKESLDIKEDLLVK